MANLKAKLKQKEELKQLHGKTIAYIVSVCDNTWTFNFTDGTSFKLWSEVCNQIPVLLTDREMSEL